MSNIIAKEIMDIITEGNPEIYKSIRGDEKVKEIEKYIENLKDCWMTEYRTY